MQSIKSNNQVYAFSGIQLLTCRQMQVRKLMKVMEITEVPKHMHINGDIDKKLSLTNQTEHLCPKLDCNNSVCVSVYDGAFEIIILQNQNSPLLMLLIMYPFTVLNLHGMFVSAKTQFCKDEKHT